MRTKAVKIGVGYLYQGNPVGVLKRIKTKIKFGANLTSFLLSNGKKVTAKELEEIL